MFEALITVVIVSIGLLGLAGLQFAGLRAVNDAYERTLAMHLTQDIVERLRANREGVNANLYNNVTLSTTSPASSGDCYSANCTTPQALVDYDTTQWLAFIKPAAGTAQLTKLRIEIKRNLAPPATFTITLTWGDAGPERTLITNTSATL